MTTTTRTHEVLENERRFWDAMRAKDGEAAAQMTDEHCIVVGAQGVSTIDRATMARMTTEGDWELERYTFDESSAQVQFVNDDVALVAYQVKEKLSVGGKPIQFDANDSSVWVRRNGEWLCAMHTESPAGDPFGRDKVATTGKPVDRR